LRPRERDELAKYRKLEAITTELARHKRNSHVALFLLAALSAVLLAVLAYHLLGHN
jgi:hypothetical protein